MKRILILMVAFLLMQMVYLFAGEEDIVWMKKTHYNYYVEFSPTNDYFLSWGSHNSRKGVIIFNTAGDTIKVIYNSEGLDFIMSQGIWDAHFSRDGRYLVVIWEYEKNNIAHGLIEVYETESWTSIKRIDVPGDDFSLLGAQVLISPDNRTLVGITQEGFYFYDFNTGELLKHIWDFGQDLSKNIIVNAGVYSNDGNHIYFTSTDVNPSTKEDEKLRFLNTQTYEVDYTIDARVSRVAISKSGNMITKLREKDWLDIINPHTKEIVTSIPISGSINTMVFSPDERYLAVNFSFVKTINIYDIQTGKSIYEYTTVPSGYALQGLSISNDQKYIVSSSGMFLYFYKFLPTTGIEKPKDLHINIIYPNPTNGSISINFNLPISGPTHISIYDNTGREIKKIFQGHLEAGEQNINADIQGLKSGNYFVKVSAVNTNITFKLIINK